MPSSGRPADDAVAVADGVAATAAAGLLLTVTGTVGGLSFAAWAGADSLWHRSRRARRRRGARRA
jgi:hypothetical protein